MFVDQTLQPNDSEPIREILPEDLHKISGSGGTLDPKAVQNMALSLIHAGHTVDLPPTKLPGYPAPDFVDWGQTLHNFRLV